MRAGPTGPCAITGNSLYKFWAIIPDCFHKTFPESNLASFIGKILYNRSIILTMPPEQRDYDFICWTERAFFSKALTWCLSSHSHTTEMDECCQKLPQTKKKKKETASAPLIRDNFHRSAFDGRQTSCRIPSAASDQRHSKKTRSHMLSKQNQPSSSRY